MKWSGARRCVIGISSFESGQRAETIGWGGGIVLGTIAAIVLFIGPLAIKGDDRAR